MSDRQSDDATCLGWTSSIDAPQQLSSPVLGLVTRASVPHVSQRYRLPICRAIEFPYFWSMGLPQHSTVPSPPLVTTISPPHSPHANRFPAWLAMAAMI